MATTGMHRPHRTPSRGLEQPKALPLFLLFAIHITVIR